MQTVTPSQKTSIVALAICFHLDNEMPVSTPMEVGTQLVQTEDNTDTVEHVPHKEIISSLMYAAMAPKPDFTLAVLVVSQFKQKPARPLWEASKHIVRYIKETRVLKLTYSASDDGIIRYMETRQWHG